MVSSTWPASSTYTTLAPPGMMRLDWPNWRMPPAGPKVPLALNRVRPAQATGVAWPGIEFDALPRAELPLAALALAFGPMTADDATSALAPECGPVGPLTRPPTGAATSLAHAAATSNA